MPPKRSSEALPELSLQNGTAFSVFEHKGGKYDSMPYLNGRCRAVAWLTPVFAQELPSEGKFPITYTAVNPAPSKAVSVGDRDVTVSSSIMTGVNDAGSVFCTTWPVAVTS